MNCDLGNENVLEEVGSVSHVYTFSEAVWDSSTYDNIKIIDYVLIVALKFRKTAD